MSAILDIYPIDWIEKVPRSYNGISANLFDPTDPGHLVIKLHDLEHFLTADLGLRRQRLFGFMIYCSQAVATFSRRRKKAV